jgi:hypothetical protein
MRKKFLKFVRKIAILSIKGIPEDVPGVGSFQNSNSFVSDQLIAETKTNLNTQASPILNSFLN